MAIHSCKHCLQTVIILLADRIELVIVTARAMRRQALKGGHGRHHHVITVIIAGDQAVGFFNRQFDVANVVPRPGRNESQSDDSVRFIRKQNVTGQLFLDKPRVGLVLIEGANHVIAIRPGMRAGFVFVITVGVGEMYGIEPVPRPTLAVARGSEQTVHQLFVSLGAAINNEPFDLLGTGWQPGQIEGQPPNQSAPGRFR